VTCARRRRAVSAMGLVTKTRFWSDFFSATSGFTVPIFEEPLLYARFVNETTISQIIAAASGAQRSALSEVESKRILDAAGIATAMAEPAHSADEAATIAARLGFPAVLKVLSPEVTHKSEAGGVALDLKSESEVREAFERIRKNLAERVSNAHFEGVAVQAMAAAGIELIAGIVRNERFGPMIVVGLGGVLVEVFNDTAMRLPPID